MRAAKNMDSVFANSMQDETEFNVLFDYEDSLVDTVNGVNEAGDPLTGVDFVDLHQDQTDATPKDFDHGAKEDRCGAPNPEGGEDEDLLDQSIGNNCCQKSDADDLYDGAECDYQKGQDGPKPDEDSVTDTINKVIEAWDSENDLSIDQLDEESDMSIDDLDDEDDGEEDVCEGCGKPKNECTCEVREGADPLDDEDEIDFDDFHLEAASGNASDKDVDDVMDGDIEDDDLDDEESMDNSGKYAYEPSDEDLIDQAMNSDDE